VLEAAAVAGERSCGGEHLPRCRTGFAGAALHRHQLGHVLMHKREQLAGRAAQQVRATGLLICHVVILRNGLDHRFAAHAGGRRERPARSVEEIADSVSGKPTRQIRLAPPSNVTFFASDGRNVTTQVRRSLDSTSRTDRTIPVKCSPPISSVRGCPPNCARRQRLASFKTVVSTVCILRTLLSVCRNLLRRRLW
jgi:hypothetical protein